MGGYGALLLGEKFPDPHFGRLSRSVRQSGPAYRPTANASPGAYASAEDFATCDVVTHAGALENTPVRLRSGIDDPFHPGVVALAAQLPLGAVVTISKGCHSGPYFASQEQPSLAFLTKHLT